MELTTQEKELLQLQELGDETIPFLRIMDAFSVANKRQLSVIQTHGKDFIMLDAAPLPSSKHGRVRLTLAIPDGWRSWGERESTVWLVRFGRGYLIDPALAGKVVWLRALVKSAELHSGNDVPEWTYD